MISVSCVLAIFTIIVAIRSGIAIREDPSCDAHDGKLTGAGYNFKNQSCYHIGKKGAIAKGSTCETERTLPIFYSKEELDFITAIATKDHLDEVCFENLTGFVPPFTWHDHTKPSTVFDQISIPPRTGDCLATKNSELHWIPCDKCPHTHVLIKRIMNPHCQWKQGEMQRPGRCYTDTDSNQCRRNQSQYVEIKVEAISFLKASNCSGNPCPSHLVHIQLCPVRDPSFKDCEIVYNLEKRRQEFCRHTREERYGEYLEGFKGIYHVYIGFYITAIILGLVSFAYFWWKDTKAKKM